MRFVVCGPPDAGKSTWVRERAKPGDLVWDFDDVAAVIGNLGNPLTRRSGKWLPPIIVLATLAMREALLIWLATMKTYGTSVYIVVTDPLSAQCISDTIHAELVTLPLQDSD